MNGMMTSRYTHTARLFGFRGEVLLSLVARVPYSLVFFFFFFFYWRAGLSFWESERLTVS